MMNPLMMDPVHPHTGTAVHGNMVYPSHLVAVGNHNSPMDSNPYSHHHHHHQQQQHFGVHGAFTIPPLHMQQHHQQHHQQQQLQQQQNGYREQTRPTSSALQKTDPTTDAHVSGDDYERSCVVYVAGLTTGTDDAAFFDAFRKFGNIMSCVRRTVDFEMKPSGQQYAFIRYSTPQEAMNAIQQGEVDIQGRKLNIRPRDRKGSRLQRPSSHGSPESRFRSYGARGGEQILKMINKNHSGSSHQSRNHHYQDRMSYDRTNTDTPQDGYHQGHPVGARPVLLSKALNVSNLPPDMGPKQLYSLFEEIGPVEGCYVFPIADSAGRRYGHIVMTSFYFAQKAVELLNHRLLGEHVLEVSYKTSNGTGEVPPPSEPSSPPLVSAVPPQMQQQQQQMFGPHPSFNQHTQHAQPFRNPPSQTGWAQNGMGNNVAHRPFGGVQQLPYGASAPHMMPSYGGHRTPTFSQPHASDSPPFGHTPSPPMHGMRWQQSSEQKQLPGSRNSHRSDVLPGLHANNYGRQHYRQEYADSLNSELQSRSVSNSTVGSNGTMATSVFPTEESFKQECENSPPENKDNKESAANSSAHTGMGQSNFETLTPPVIPEAKKPTDPCNLFIKNLDDCVISTSEDLKNLFEPFGQVASAHLATYPESKVSRGYGFVAFAKAEDAAKAKDKINNILVGKKRVFVSYAERKEDRAKRLKSIFQGKNPDEEEDEKEKEKHEVNKVAPIMETKEKPVDASVVVGGPTSVGVEEPPKTNAELPDTSKKAELEPGPKRGGCSRNKAHAGGQKGGNSKCFKSTPLDRITEDEEEKAALARKPAGDSDTTSADVPEDIVTPPDASAKVSVSSTKTNKTEAEATGAKAGTGNNTGKRSARRSTGTQKITSSQVQTAVPSFKQISSLGRSSSRIPVQNMGGPLQNIPPTGPRLNNDIATQNQNNPTATTIAAAGGGANHYPKRRSGYRGNNPRNGRNPVDKIGADGGSNPKEGEQKGAGGTKKIATGSTGTAPVAAH